LIALFLGHTLPVPVRQSTRPSQSEQKLEQEKELQRRLVHHQQQPNKCNVKWRRKRLVPITKSKQETLHSRAQSSCTLAVESTQEESEHTGQNVALVCGWRRQNWYRATATPRSSCLAKYSTIYKCFFDS
jgi:hypothetical protein